MSDERVFARYNCKELFILFIDKIFLHVERVSVSRATVILCTSNFWRQEETGETDIGR